MDLKFGHGFLPRIGQENYKAVDRCLGPADLFNPDPLTLPWAVVDGAWAEDSPDLLGALRRHGTKIIVDTAGWRFRYKATMSIAKLRDATWSPGDALSIADEAGARRLVEASLRAQAAVGADAYLVPGWMPETPTEDLCGPYEWILDKAASFNDVPAKPLILWVGGHTQGADALVALLDSIPHFVSGVYLQLSPIEPAKESPAKLESITAFYRQATSRGFAVIGGHAGALTPALRALGIDAADAGLATTETFDRSRAKRPPTRSNGDDGGGGSGARMYFGEIGRSLSKKDVTRLLAVPAAAAELRSCRLPCHRHRAGDLIDQAREHSLWARVTEAELVNSLPSTMRATSVYERLRTQRSVLTTINGALASAGQVPLDVKPLDNQMALARTRIELTANRRTHTIRDERSSRRRRDSRGGSSHLNNGGPRVETMTATGIGASDFGALPRAPDLASDLRVRVCESGRSGLSRVIHTTLYPTYHPDTRSPQSNS